MRALRLKPVLRGIILASLAATASGCSSTQPVILTAQTLCKDWPVLTRSKSDKITQETAGQMAASNAARPEYGCHPEKNEARG